MLGKLAPATGLTEKYHSVLELFATAECLEVLDKEYIPLLEDEFEKIARIIGADFRSDMKSARAKCAVESNAIVLSSSVTDPVKWPRYREVARHLVMAAMEANLNFLVGQISAEVERLKEPVQQTWTQAGMLNVNGTIGPPKMSKKEWLEKNKDKIESSRQDRDNTKKELTAFRNDTLTPEQESKVTRICEELFEQSGGVLTDEQIQARLVYLLERCFQEERAAEQFFPTPDDIIQKYLIPNLALRAGMRVLEPSAGRANIADAVRAACPQCDVEVCEINDLRREILELKNYRVVGQDFLKFGVRSSAGAVMEYEPGYQNRYDAIVMNPPFNRGADITHVKRAFEFLKPGGTLVAIISGGSAHSISRRDAAAFRNWLDRNGGLKPGLITAAEYSQHQDRKIAIDIGLIVINKPLTAEKADYDVPELTLPVTGADINYTAEIDTNFVPANIVVANAHLVKPAKNDVVPDTFKRMSFIRDYVFEGVNKAIESIEATKGFLLSDGTGAGKTIQELLVARHYYLKTGKPVLLFTIDDRVMQTGVFEDAQKLGFATPDKIDMTDTGDAPKRPKNYTGLYGLGDSADSAEVTVHQFHIKYPSLKDGINVTTYHNLSQWQGNPQLVQKMNELAQEVKRRDKAHSAAWKAELELLDKQFPKNPMTNRREKTGYKAAKEEAREAWERNKKNDGVYADYIEAIQAVQNNRVDSMKKWCGSACLVIFDEAHKIKNVGEEGKASSQRAELGRAITENAERVMFVTATPCDRPGDLLYLKRAGLFQSDEQFRNLMAEIGIVWVEPEYNDGGKMIRFGRWDASDMEPGIMTNRLTNIFAGLYEDGYMLRRELELRNLDVKMRPVVVPGAATSMMDSIEEYLTVIDDDGKERKNYADIYNRQLEELERYKMQETIAITNEAIARGRNVVIFVRSVDEGTDIRPWSGEPKPGAVRTLKETFAKMYGEDMVGVIVGTAGAYEEYRRLENVTQFQQRKRRILIGTVESGGTGLNLDDTIGNAPRTMIIVTSPLSFINVVQGVGRIVRAKTASRSECHFLFAKGVAVDEWLSGLLALKFATLHATVQGEIKALDISAMNGAADAGEEGAANVIAAAGADTNKSPKHTRFSEKNNRFDGWSLPNKLPYYVEQSGTPTQTLITIGGKTKEDLQAWADANAAFILKFGLVKNPDENYRKYHGFNYGRKFNDRKQAANLWNALLNVIDLQSTMYYAPNTQTFNIGERVVTVRSLQYLDLKTGAAGEVKNVRVIPLSKNADGVTINEYRYDVAFDNGTAGVRLQDADLKREASAVVRFPVGTVFIEKGQYYEHLDQYYQTKYTVIEPEDEGLAETNVAVNERSMNKLWKRDWRNMIMWNEPILGLEWGKWDYRRDYDIDDVLDNLRTGKWTCEKCEGTNYSMVAGLSGLGELPSGIQGDFLRTVQLFAKAKELGVIDYKTAREIEIELHRVSLSIGANYPDYLFMGCPPKLLNGERCITPECIEQLTKCIAAMPDTKLKNTDANGNYTPERKKLHRKIVEHYLANKPCRRENPIAVFTGGASGSGKSTFLKRNAKYLTSDEVLKVDIDEMREFLPEYVKWNADKTQSEVKDIYNQIIDELGKECRYDVVIDGTMNKSKNYLPLIAKLKQHGYKVFVIYIRVDKATSLQRVRERYVRSGRYVPDFVVEEIFANGETPMREVVSHADGYMIADNKGGNFDIVEHGGLPIPHDREDMATVFGQNDNAKKPTTT